MSPFAVVGAETDMAGGRVYAIYSWCQGHVGFVTVRPCGTRLYQKFDRSLLMLTKLPTVATAWDQAVNEYTEVYI